jgi:hypothetical protein
MDRIFFVITLILFIVRLNVLQVLMQSLVKMDLEILSLPSVNGFLQYSTTLFSNRAVCCCDCPKR